MWCHVLLAMPVIGLGLFFVLPLATALPIYLLVVALSFALYYKITESMHAPVRTGPEALIGREVVTTEDGSIRWQGEWWTAQPRLPRQRVRVVGLKGLNLVVEPVEPASTSGLTSPVPGTSSGPRRPSVWGAGAHRRS